MPNLKSESLKRSSIFNLSTVLSDEQKASKTKIIRIPAISDSSYIEIKSLMTLNETKSLIRLVENIGFQSPVSSYPPSYRNNQRMVVDDDQFAEKLRARISNSVPAIIVDEDGVRWQFQGINTRFRFCQYNQGEAFFIHQDGVFHRSETEKSFLTLLVYLNDQSAFKGGATRFFSSHDDASEPILMVAPESGMALLFNHSLWHDGAEIFEGTKYVLRSDLIYSRVEEIHKDPFRISGAVQPHSGYIWDLTIVDGKIITCGRDKRIVIWKDEGTRLVAEAELLGHQNSISTISSVKNYLWSGSRDQSIKIWKKNTESFYSEFQTLTAHNSTILNIVHLIDQGCVASSDASGLVAIWSEEGTLLSKFQAHENWIWKMADLGNGLFATASEDGYLKIWDCIDSRLIASINDGLDPIWSLSVYGNFLFIGTNQGAIKKIKIGRGDSKKIELQITDSIEKIHGKGIRSIKAFCENSFLSGGEDNKVVLTSLEENNHVELDLVVQHKNFVTAVATYLGKVLSTSYDGSILISPFKHEVQSEY